MIQSAPFCGLQTPFSLLLNNNVKNEKQKKVNNIENKSKNVKEKEKILTK